MIAEQPRGQPEQAPRFLPLIFALFIGSGCAALVYEIVWFQLLQLVIGSSAVSLGVLLGTFMGGMCLGSLWLPRLIPPRHHPLRVYAVLELAIGILGILVVLGMPFIGRLYTTLGGHGPLGILLRGLFSGICLLPPTMLMGATLPVIARWVGTTRRGVSRLGLLYGGNIAGAVLGCLGAGFYLLRVYDMPAATYVAAVLNVVAAVIAFALARITPYPGAEDSAARKPAAAAPGSWPVYVTIALSGMSALGAEVVWTRQLTLLLGGTTYTFSIILAIFLIGLGLGSGIGSYAAREVVRPRRALGISQFLLMGAIAWSAWMIAESLPYWPINPALTRNAWVILQVDFVRCLWAILPAASLWGASFPLALASAASEGQDPGRMVGAVYAANTVGAIAGALVFSTLLIPWLGTQASQRILITCAALATVLMLGFWSPRESGHPGFDKRSAVWLLLIIGIALGLASSVPRIPGLLVAYGRFMTMRLQDRVDIIYVGEGMNSSMAVSRLPNGVLNYHNAGKIQASSEPQDMRLQLMLGHLTTLLPEHPRSILVIGCGAGVTAGAVSINPRVERVTIAEIEPLVPQVVSKYFSEYNYDVVRNPKVRVELDDARHYLLTTREKFDAITSDPFDPWVKGAATLYTKEFFEEVREHLNPGGVATVFVQLYQSSTDVVKSEIATFLQVFPNGVVLGNTYDGAGYDLVMLGRLAQTPIDLDEMERRLRTQEFAQVAQSLRKTGFYSAVDLFSTFAAEGPQLKRWLQDAQINRDRNLRLQYLAGLVLNESQEAAIYWQILACRRFPENLFTASPERLQALKLGIAAAR
jgi:spermidine synthase